MGKGPRSARAALRFKPGAKSKAPGGSAPRAPGDSEAAAGQGYAKLRGPRARFAVAGAGRDSWPGLALWSTEDRTIAIAAGFALGLAIGFALTYTGTNAPGIAPLSEQVTAGLGLPWPSAGDGAAAEGAQRAGGIKTGEPVPSATAGVAADPRVAAHEYIQYLSELAQQGNIEMMPVAVDHVHWELALDGCRRFVEDFQWAKDGVAAAPGRPGAAYNLGDRQGAMKAVYDMGCIFQVYRRFTSEELNEAVEKLTVDVQALFNEFFDYFQTYLSNDGTMSVEHASELDERLARLKQVFKDDLGNVRAQMKKDKDILEAVNKEAWLNVEPYSVDIARARALYSKQLRLEAKKKELESKMKELKLREAEALRKIDESTQRELRARAQSQRSIADNSPAQKRRKRKAHKRSSL